MMPKAGIMSYICIMEVLGLDTLCRHNFGHLTIIPPARMSYESIADYAEGRHNRPSLHREN